MVDLAQHLGSPRFNPSTMIKQTSKFVQFHTKSTGEKKILDTFNLTKI